MMCKGKGFGRGLEYEDRALMKGLVLGPRLEMSLRVVTCDYYEQDLGPWV